MECTLRKLMVLCRSVFFKGTLTLSWSFSSGPCTVCSTLAQPSRYVSDLTRKQASKFQTWHQLTSVCATHAHASCCICLAAAWLASTLPLPKLPKLPKLPNWNTMIFHDLFTEYKHVDGLEQVLQSCQTGIQPIGWLHTNTKIQYCIS